jgi:hypothetical protein
VDLKDLVNDEQPLGRQADGKETASAAPQVIKWVVIKSRLLDGQQVLLVLQKKHLKEARQEHPDKVIYFPPEIKELGRHRGVPGYEDLLRKVHLVKKEFGGWIVPSDSPVHRVSASIQEGSAPPAPTRMKEEMRQTEKSNTPRGEKKPARAEQMRISYGGRRETQP